MTLPRLKSSLVAVGATGCLLSPMGWAATSGSFDITGDVQAVTTLVKKAAETPINMVAGVAVTDQAVVTLTILSNNATGYDVTLQSANSSMLKLGGVGPDEFAYTLKYDGTEYDLSSGAAINVENSSFQTFGEEDRPITVSIAAGATTASPGGTYTDIVTFAIVAK